MIFIPNPVGNTDYRFILLSKIKLNKDEMFKKAIKKSAPIPNTYFDRFISKIFHAIFFTCQEFEEEYLLFYSQEYLNFEDYLYHKKLYDEEEIEEILEWKSQGYFLYFGNLKNGLDYNLASLVIENNEDYENAGKILNTVKRILENLENEN